MWELGLLGGWFKNKNNTKIKSPYIFSSKVNCSGPLSFQPSIWKMYVELPFGSSVVSRTALVGSVSRKQADTADMIHKPLGLACSAGKCITKHSFLPSCWTGCREQGLWWTID